ncbi:hypothetical protein MPER_10721 [Moniliophthora perniciosa FA553]|nr:hypothetical protein MPER_10721 [Moniliophthora perniciosa FA553]
MYPGAILAPVGLFWYGWSAQAHLHWIMPVLGSAIFCFGMIASLIPVQLYFLDSFTYAASALAATSSLRFAFGFAFPLFVPYMIGVMGYGGTYSFFSGVLLLIGVPFPLWIYYKGEEASGFPHGTFQSLSSTFTFNFGRSILFKTIIWL